MSRSQLFTLMMVGLFCKHGFAQTKPLALPSHNGAMLLDLDGFHITQLSAKPQGREIGVRAHDTNHTELLAFLFLTPEHTSQSAVTCLQQDLNQIKRDSGKVTEQLDPDRTDDGQVATMLLTQPNGFQSFYKYAGAGDQCLVVQVYADRGTKLDTAQASTILKRQRYDPHYSPTTDDEFRYANVLYQTGQMTAAIPLYKDFIANAPNDRSSGALTMRRIATDNMGMALGMSGKIDDARKLFSEAAKQDPNYPLNYYNLACADAEEGKVADAKLHLQQAFEHKANTIPGEKMPDPTKDDSIQKLKNNKEFWAFVQTLK